MKVAIIYPNLDGTPQSLDMGVAYLSTYIDERTTHEVKIIDMTFHKRDWKPYLKKEIENFRPDVAGISIVSLYFDYAKEIAKQVKKYNVPIIVGGFQATMAPEETIGVKEFDALCIGDGEYTLEEYLQMLENKGSLKTVKGIWYKENGNIIKNESRDYIRDLDALPMPNYDLFDDIDKYLFFMKRLYVIGSRGCPYQCTFCAESVLPRLSTGKRFRTRNPRKYVQEILYLFNKYGERGMKAAHVYDSVFTFNYEWLKEWVDEYIKTGLSKVLPYSVFLKADRNNATEEKIKLLFESNCLQVRIGIESGDSEIRDNIIKKKTGGDDIILDVLDRCNKNGLIVKSYAIFGIPEETKKSIQTTFKFCKNPLIHIPLCFSYTPIPGTPLAERASLIYKSKRAEKMYSFHFSKGAKIKGISPQYVPWMIIKSYAYFGTRLAWNLFISNHGFFLDRVLRQTLRAVIYGSPLSVAAGHALINPEFWPNLSKHIKKRYDKLRKNKNNRVKNGENG